ncbi:MAG: membrane dipeptidase [Deltaproteobacteria bacterium]|nr:membrane dipeptidase [Deltaproteobacteria bacterium]
MNRRAKELLEQAIVVDGHNHMMMEIARRRYRGDKAVFSNYHAALFGKAGVNIIMTQVGGDNSSLADDTDLLLWGSISTLDMLWEEAEEDGEVMAICRNSKEIDAALAKGKIAVLLTMEGGRPLEGKPHHQTLAGLRNFYRQGLRGLQLVDNGRNRLCDGKGEARTQGGLTNFGVAVVKEMNRLGMLIDLAHISEPGFWDVLEASEDPVVDSHSNCQAVCNHLRNLTDDQIKALAQKGGVVGLSCNNAMTSKDKDKPTVADLMKHLEHIVELVGIDYVGLGPDFIEPHNLLTTQGWLEGVFYVVRESHYIENIEGPSGMPLFMELFTESLVNRGFKDEDIKKVLGGNWLRVYRQVIG